jgi:potassium-transporting ATPase potassium-binding subunit
MNIYGWLQLLIFIVILFVLTKPVGIYLMQVLDPAGKTIFDPMLRPAEKLFYRLLGVDTKKEQSWQAYAVSLLLFSFVGFLFTYVILRLQYLLPLNPQGFGPVSEHLAFNTAASFTTNTNWQSYGGESTLSYFSQMVGLVFHNFTSAAVGIAVAAALVRGISRQSGHTIGNFWVDLVRVNLYLLVPLSMIYALFLVSQGVIQNFKPYDVVKLVETSDMQISGTQQNNHEITDQQKMRTQTMAQGPVASQVAIKMLGTNGGGFFNANAAHPFENPTPLSNFAQILSIFLIPSGLTYYLGRMVKNRRHGWTVWGVMLALFLAGFLTCWWAEASGSVRLGALGVDVVGGNMEGKEVRFGIFASALFATVTTDASCGAVNAMHDSFTPIGGLITLFNIQLGEVVFGGVGAGLYGMLVFIVLTVFLAGLMVGRTPEYLGKKIEANDIKLSVLFVMVPVLTILGFTSWAAVSLWGQAGPGNAGPHGFSEILYAFSSAVGNNGSAFAGLTTNSPWYNTTMGIAMLLGRFFMIVPVLALAGNMAQKKQVATSGGSFPVSGIVFAILLIGTIIIVGALTFLPALALGPIVEHLLMTGSQILY